MEAPILRIVIILTLACGLLAACATPPRDVPVLSQVEVAGDAGRAEALPAPEETSEAGGFLSGVADAPAPDPQAAPRRRGLLGLFGRRSAAARDAAPETAQPVAPEAEPERAEPDPAELVARAGRGGAPAADAAKADSGGGFFSALFGGGTDRQTPGPSAGAGAGSAKTGPGVTLPFGELARLCGTPERALGARVARYPERGGRYTLYDSQPGNNAAHSWYVTGFDDGCARQFTAALALFGGPEDYEVLRYGPAGDTLPVSVTDRAYERLKSRVCGVRRDRPCGNRIGRLAQNTVFVTIYPSFDGAGAWKSVLLHDGAVLASDVKRN